MTYRLLAAALVVLATSQARAGTIATSLSDWQAGVGFGVGSVSSSLTDYDVTDSIALSNGILLGAPAVTKLTTGPFTATPAPTWQSWSGGYEGEVFDTAGSSQTITFGAVNALAFEVEGDGGFFPGGGTHDFTITLSSGASVTLQDVADDGGAQFFGFFGGGETSVTITSTASDFAFGDIRAVPEPASLAVMAVGLLGLGRLRRRS